MRVPPALFLSCFVVLGAGLLAWTDGASSRASSQVATKVDFRRDLQPLLQEHCVECHGPEEQSGGFRFDKRRSVRKVAGRLQPGSSATSRMYLRLVNDDFGPRMPRDSEQLRPDQIAMVRNWIDQGQWPDDLAGGDPPAAARSVATQMMAPPPGRRAGWRVWFAPGPVHQSPVIGGATPDAPRAVTERAVRLLLNTVPIRTSQTRLARPH